MTALNATTFVYENLKEPAFETVCLFELVKVFPSFLEGSLDNIFGLRIVGAEKSPSGRKSGAMKPLEKFVETTRTVNSAPIWRREGQLTGVYGLAFCKHLTC